MSWDPLRMSAERRIRGAFSMTGPCVGEALLGRIGGHGTVHRGRPAPHEYFHLRLQSSAAALGMHHMNPMVVVGARIADSASPTFKAWLGIGARPRGRPAHR